MTEFLEKGYEVPASASNYLKLIDGENNFRILSSAIVGYVYWTNDKKPVRGREQFAKRPENIRLNKDGTWSQKHFWAFAVWDYNDNAVKILEITQSTIQKAIKALIDNAKWGAVFGYDITITRSGEGLETQYSIMPNPHSELQAEIVEEYKNKPVNLEALFENGDPFEASEQPKTQEQINEEEEVLKACDKL